MDIYENITRIRIAESLGELAEKMIRRVPPFDQFQIDDEFAGYLFMKYVKYYCEIPDHLKKRIFEMLIAEANESIQINSGISQELSFDSRFPEHVKTSEKFTEWIIQREGRPSSTTSKISSIKIKVNQVVKQIMKSRFPDFPYDKHSSSATEIYFSAHSFNDNCIYIVVERGTKRQALSFMFSVRWPESYFDIASFFGGAQSWYGYNTEKELIDAINKGIDLVVMMLPHFTDAVKKALESDSNNLSTETEN